MAVYCGKRKKTSETSDRYSHGCTKCLQRQTKLLGSGLNQGICKKTSSETDRAVDTELSFVQLTFECDKELKSTRRLSAAVLCILPLRP